MGRRDSEPAKKTYNFDEWGIESSCRSLVCQMYLNDIHNTATYWIDILVYWRIPPVHIQNFIHEQEGYISTLRIFPSVICIHRISQCFPVHNCLRFMIIINIVGSVCHNMETRSWLLSICYGTHQSSVDFSEREPVMCYFGVSFVVCLFEQVVELSVISNTRTLMWRHTCVK